MSLIITQAHLSSCHVTNVNTSTSVPIMFLMTTQAHLIMLPAITQEQPSSHHVAYDNTSPCHRPSVAFGNTSPQTISFLCSLPQKFPVLYEVTSSHSSHSTHAVCVFIQYTSHRGTIIYCRPRGLTSFNSTCSWNNEICTVLWTLQPISESTHKEPPYFRCYINQ